MPRGREEIPRWTRKELDSRSALGIRLVEDRCSDGHDDYYFRLVSHSMCGFLVREQKKYGWKQLAVRLAGIVASPTLN